MRQRGRIEVVYKKSTSLYDYNVAFLKEYREGVYKVQRLKCVRKQGVSNSNYSAKNSVNENKLDCNLRRAKNTIKELVMCNEWEYFATLTLDKTKYDRYDLKKYIKDLSQYVRDLRKKGNDIKYLLIPERHKDGAWHIHGFFAGLNQEELKEFSLSEKLPSYIKNSIKQGKKLWNWVGYSRKFGFNELEEIRDIDKVSSYVTKYITKDLSDTVSELGAKTYYCSRGLKRAKTIKRGYIAGNYIPSYVKVDTNTQEEIYSEMWLQKDTSLDEAKSYIKNYSDYSIISRIKSIPWKPIDDKLLSYLNEGLVEGCQE